MATSTVWVSWVSGTTSTSASTSCYSDTWGYWTADSGTTASSSTAWETWISNGIDFTRSPCVAQVPVLSAEEIESRRIAAAERERVYREAEEKRKAEREAAESRAKELLTEFLTPSQKQMLETMQAIALETITGKKYRIHKGWIGNIDELDDAGNVVATLCVHPNENVPEYDNMLSQLLMLQTDEARLVRTANRTPRR